MRKDTQKPWTQFQPVALDTKAGGAGYVEGYASTFEGDPDSYGHIIMPGAFQKSLTDSAARGEIPAMLWAHAMERPIGKWTALSEDSRGLHVRGQFNLKTAEGREAYEHVTAGDATGLSIGCQLNTETAEYAGEGRFKFFEVDLLEISIVTVPANRHARITAAKSFTSKSDIADALREMGVAKKAANIIAAGGWQALAGQENHHEQVAKLAAQIDRATALFTNGTNQ
tara:strand:- start:1300 stop:1980 length:681 start_codon:yes stop_codon:yes gene_type:complete